MEVQFMDVFIKSLIIFISIQNVIAKRDFRIFANEASCAHRAPHFIESFGCHLEQRKGRSYGYGFIQFQRPVKELYLRFAASGTGTNMPFFNLINVRINFCDLFRTNQSNIFLGVFTKNVLTFVNEKPTCPLKEHFNYTITGLFVDEEDLPPYMPRGNFHVNINFYEKETVAGRFVLGGKIYRKGKTNSRKFR